MLQLITSVSGIAHTLYVLVVNNTALVADLRELITDVEKLINDFKAAKGIAE